MYRRYSVHIYIHIHMHIYIYRCVCVLVCVSVCARAHTYIIYTIRGPNLEDVRILAVKAQTDRLLRFGAVGLRDTANSSSVYALELFLFWVLFYADSRIITENTLVYQVGVYTTRSTVSSVMNIVPCIYVGRDAWDTESLWFRIRSLRLSPVTCFSSNRVLIFCWRRVLLGDAVTRIYFGGRVNLKSIGKD